MIIRAWWESCSEQEEETSRGASPPSEDCIVEVASTCWCLPDSERDVNAGDGVRTFGNFVPECDSMTKPREGRGNLKPAPLKLSVPLRDQSLKSCSLQPNVHKALRDKVDISFLNIQ